MEMLPKSVDCRYRRFDPSTSPKDNQLVIKEDGTKNTMTILVKPMATIERWHHTINQSAARVGFS
jgi:hypothetical protein